MIDSQNNSSKNLWKTLVKCLNKNKIKHNKINQLSHNNSKLTNSQDISETINNFFSEIGPSLASHFDNANNNEHKKYLSTPAPQSILLHSINAKEIHDTIKSLKNSNSSGHDFFTTKFVNLSAPILVPALEKIFNLALKTGVYPDSLEIAKVIPVFKKRRPIICQQL